MLPSGGRRQAQTNQSFFKILKLTTDFMVLQMRIFSFPRVRPQLDHPNHKVHYILHEGERGEIQIVHEVMFRFVKNGDLICQNASELRRRRWTLWRRTCSGKKGSRDNSRPRPPKMQQRIRQNLKEIKQNLQFRYLNHFDTFCERGKICLVFLGQFSIVIRLFFWLRFYSPQSLR